MSIEQDKKFCQTLLMDLATLNASYNELLRMLDDFETRFRQRFGGIPNVGNPEVGHRISFLDRLIGEKFNGL